MGLQAELPYALGSTKSLNGTGHRAAICTGKPQVEQVLTQIHGRGGEGVAVSLPIQNKTE